MENKPKSKMNKSLLILGIGLLIIGLLLILTFILTFAFSDTEKSINQTYLYLGAALLAVGIIMAGWQIRERMLEKSGSEKDRWR